MHSLSVSVFMSAACDTFRRLLHIVATKVCWKLHLKVKQTVGACCWLTLSMDLSRSPTFLSWSLQRMTSRSPGRISALMMPMSAPVTGRTIPPTPELEGAATCWWGQAVRKKKKLREVGSERTSRDEGERIKEESYINIQLKIKRNAPSHGDMWEDLVSSTPPPGCEML